MLSPHVRNVSEAIPTAWQRFELTSSALWSKSPWLGDGLGLMASRKCAPRHDKSDLTTRNSAEGRAGKLKIAKNHEFSRVDQVRRGSRGTFENRKKPRVFEGRPTQSPQRVAQAICSQKTTSFRRSTSPKSAEGRAGDLKIAKNHEFSKVDQPKVRRGSRGRFENRKKPRVFDGRPAQSPQRVARAILKMAKNHEFSKVNQPKVRRGLRERFENRKKPRVFEGRRPETTTGPQKTARQVEAPK